MGLYTRVYTRQRAAWWKRGSILEYGSANSSIQLLSALQLHTVSRSARATSDVSTISHKPEIGLRRNQWHLKLDIQCVILIYNTSQKVSRWRSYGFYKLTHVFTSCSRPSFNVLSISHNLQILLSYNWCHWKLDTQSFPTRVERTKTELGPGRYGPWKLTVRSGSWENTQQRFTRVRN